MAADRWKAIWRNRDVRVTILLLAAAGAILIALIASAVYLGARERARSLEKAELALAVEADEAARRLAAWLQQKDDLLTRAAQNPTLQLYAGLGDQDPAAEAAADYARTLLLVTAEQGAWLQREPISANYRTQSGGIALVDLQGRPRLALGEWPQALGKMPGSADWSPRRLHADAQGLWMVWTRPILAAQDAKGKPAAALIAWMRVEEVLQALTRSAGRDPGHGRPALVLLARMADGLRALTPVPGIATDAPWTLAVLPRELVAAVAQPASLVQAARAEGRRMLAFAQPVSGVDSWWLAAEVDAEGVLAGAQAAARRFLLVSVLVVGLLALVLLLLWRHAANRRLTAVQAEQEDLIARLERQRRFLEAATDAQPTEILVVDHRGLIRFANRRVREEFGGGEDGVLDRPIETVLGPDPGRELRLIAESAFADGPLQDTQEVNTESGERRLYVINAVPLKAGEALDDEVCLLVREEVTSFVEERERRERTLKRLVATLAALIDARDPYAAKQSERVVEVASALATSLNLTLYETEAVEIAGRLMNIGKMLVPREILIKKGRLTEEELAKVRAAMRKSADLLTGIEFDGPVVETLRQINARVDGTGDPPLKGDEILITARILAVANAFVAMVSPRAHRKGLSIDEALAELQKEAGSRFDRGVVAALAHQIENLDGRRRWARFAEMPSDLLELGD